MSKQGFSVIVAGPELAKAMPKMFKSGKSYVVANASVLGERTTTTTKQAATTKASKPGPKQGKAAKQGKAPKAAKTTKTTAPKAPKKGASDNVVKFVKANPGCNMTQIEAGTKLPQADIRKALNVARESGAIRTEGQRRGLRYFASGASGDQTPAPAAATAAASTTSEPPAAGNNKNQPW